MHAHAHAQPPFPIQCDAQDAEACIPLPRLADFGLDLGVDAIEGAPMEERASCLFVRRVAEERRRASACFSRVASPDPPYELCHSNHKPFTHTHIHAPQGRLA